MSWTAKILIVVLITISIPIVYTKYFQPKPLVEIPARFAGAWATDCQPKAEQHKGPHRIFRDLPANKMYNEYYVLYLDSACTVPLTVQRAFGSYELQPLHFRRNRFDLNLTIGHIAMVMAHPKAVKSANAANVMGRRDWRRDEDRNITAEAGIPDIVEFREGRLFFGERLPDKKLQRPSKIANIGFSRIDSMPDVHSFSATNDSKCIADAKRAFALLESRKERFKTLNKSLDEARTKPGTADPAFIEQQIATVQGMASDASEALKAFLPCLSEECSKGEDSSSCDFDSKITRISIDRDFLRRK